MENMLEIDDVEIDPSMLDLRFVTRAYGISMGPTDKGDAIVVVLRDENRAPIAFAMATPETLRALLNRCMEVQ